MPNTLRFFLLLFIKIVFTVYIFLLTLRLFLQFFQANGHPNRITRFINKAANFIVKPLQRFVPVYRNFNFAIALAIFILQYVEVNAVVWLRYDHLPAQAGILLWTFGSIIMTLCDIGFYLLFLRAIFSWIEASFDNPFFQITFALTEPLLKPVRRYLPRVGLFDLSPLLLAILLQVIIVLLLAPLLKMGQSMALGPLLGSA